MLNQRLNQPLPVRQATKLRADIRGVGLNLVGVRTIVPGDGALEVVMLVVDIVVVPLGVCAVTFMDEVAGVGEVKPRLRPCGGWRTGNDLLMLDLLVSLRREQIVDSISEDSRPHRPLHICHVSSEVEETCSLKVVDDMPPGRVGDNQSGCFTERRIIQPSPRMPEPSSAESAQPRCTRCLEAHESCTLTALNSSRRYEACGLTQSTILTSASFSLVLKAALSQDPGGICEGVRRILVLANPAEKVVVLVLAPRLALVLLAIFDDLPSLR